MYAKPVAESVAARSYVERSFPAAQVRRCRLFIWSSGWRSGVVSEPTDGVCVRYLQTFFSEPTFLGIMGILSTTRLDIMLWISQSVTGVSDFRSEWVWRCWRWGFWVHCGFADRLVAHRLESVPVAAVCQAGFRVEMEVRPLLLFPNI